MNLECIFRMAIKAGDTVIDIGAFEGDMSEQFAGLVGNGGRVHAFEPHPSRFLELSRKAYGAAARNIFPYCRAIADFTGHCPMYLAPPATAKSSTIIPGLGTEQRLGAGIETCLVETQTLDDFVRSSSCRPQFIKMDTEGAEKLVFSGGTRVIEAFRPVLVFEGSFGYAKAQQAYCFNEPVPAHVTWLESIGYRVFIIDIDYLEDGWVTPVSPAHCSGYGLLSISAPDFRRLPLLSGNLLAVHASHPLATAIDAANTAEDALEYLSRSFTLYSPELI